MTSETSAPQLRRRVADRVIGGVAGGLGDYFNIDPLLFRIGFVGLMIFGGAGLVIYLVAWLLLPAEGHDVSALEGVLRRLGLTARGIGILVLAAFTLLLVTQNGGYLSMSEGPGGIPGAVWALAVIVAGVLLLRRREEVPAEATAPVTAVEVRPPAPRAAPRPRSALGWYVVAATLIAVGLIAIVSQVAAAEVTPGQFFGAALTVIGIGLVVGAWWGRARILVLLAILLAPIGIVASFVTAPLEGGFGDVRFAPANAAELRDEYRLMGGQMLLDLTELSVGTREVRISASVAVGQLVVVVPSRASVEVETRVGGGAAIVFGTQYAGTSLESRFVRRHQYGTTFILDLESGLGEVQIVSEGQGY
jgi:phage shock protein PspC (stress-responsive transcriptional regulator)